MEEKYNEAEDKTCLELLVADGLKAEKETPIKRKPKSYGLYNQPFPFTLPKYTTYTFLTSLEWGLRSKGILKPKDEGLV